MPQILSKIIVGIIAILVLNCSIEAPYPQIEKKWDGKDYVEDLSYNDIESIYELVTECWMDMDNHVPEDNDDDDNEDTKVEKDYKWLPPQFSSARKKPGIQVRDIHTYHEDIYISVIAEYTSPPPDISIA